MSKFTIEGPIKNPSSGELMIKTLFICKQSENYSQPEYTNRKHSGLYNSASMVADMLNSVGIESVLEIAIDNNCIDRLVTQHKPSHVFIEAYWVVPEKFEILARLHPTVKWIVRMHSEIPFWATEGVAVEWTLRYLDFPNVYIAPNSKAAYNDIHTILSTKYEHVDNSRVIYLPNYYPINVLKPYKKIERCNDELHVGCFGAIRPLKNQLIQAIAAIRYANIKDKTLYFHINGTRVEGNGQPVLKNIRKLFESSRKHRLVEHSWMPHQDFLDLVDSMDLGMQVSFSESFNIVAADFVAMGKPVVVSSEIDWVAKRFFADTTNSISIMKAMYRAEALGATGVYLNRYLLETYSDMSSEYWIDYLTY